MKFLLLLLCTSFFFTDIANAETKSEITDAKSKISKERQSTSTETPKEETDQEVEFVKGELVPPHR